MRKQHALKVLLSSNGLPPYAETASAEAYGTFNLAVLGSLLELNSDFSLSPELLESCIWNREARTYTLKLKTDLQFHSGRRVTSTDLEFSLLRGFLSANRGFYEVSLRGIAGIDDVPSRVSFRSGMVSGIRLIDPESIEVQMNAASPLFPYIFNDEYFSLVPMEEFEQDYLTWRSSPIGAGPFKVAKRFHEGRMLLEPVEPNAPLPSVEIFCEDLMGEYDISYSESSSVGNRIVNSADPVGVTSIFFSRGNELGRLESFRRVIDLTVDRNHLALPNSQVPTSELLPSRFRPDGSFLRTNNLGEARKLLLEVPRELLDRRWKVPVFSSGPFSESRRTLLKNLSAQFSQVGLDFDFFPSSEKFLSDVTAKDSPMKISSRVVSMIDPLMMFVSLRSSSAYRYEKPDYDADLELLFDNAFREETREGRLSATRLVTEYVREKSMIVPFAEQHESVRVNSRAIESLGRQMKPYCLKLDEVRIRV